MRLANLKAPDGAGTPDLPFRECRNLLQHDILFVVS